MKKLVLKAGQIQTAMNFLFPGFEKTGTHPESQLLHIEAKEKFLIFTTRNRYVIGRFAIDMGKELESFSTLIQYERFRNLINTYLPETRISLIPDENRLTVQTNGRYSFVVYDTYYSLEMPKVDAAGKADYATLHKLLTLAKPFTSIDKATVSANKAIRLVYNETDQTLKSMVIDNSVAAQFEVKLSKEAKIIPFDIHRPFDVYLKGTLVSKMQANAISGEAKLYVNDDQSAFSIVGHDGKAKMVMSTLNDLEESAGVVETVLGEHRPHYFTVDLDIFEVILQRMVNFAPDDIHVSAAASEKKVTFTAQEHGKVLAQESMECEDIKGHVNIRMPIRVVTNIVKLLSNSGGKLKFQVNKDGTTAMVTGPVSDNIIMTVGFSTEGEDSE